MTGQAEIHFDAEPECPGFEGTGEHHFSIIPPRAQYYFSFLPSL